MEKAILVTGGLGFIGSNLIRQLLKTTEYHIVVLDKVTYAGRKDNLPYDYSSRKRISLIKGDVTNRKDVDKAVRRASVIIHLAAETHASNSVINPLKTTRTNIMGTAELLESAVKHDIKRFIFISSSEVYGDQQEKYLMNEDHPLAPVTPYAVSKLAGDRLAHSFFLTKKLPVVILRLFNAYGPRQHTEKMMPLFITKLIKNLPITLHHGGKQKRDWVYVEDHINAIVLALHIPIKKIAGETFNIGTGKSTSVYKIAKLILREVHKDTSLIHVMDSTQKATMGNVGVSKKAKRILGWEPKTSLSEGMEKTVKWYMQNKDWWDTIA